MLRSIKELMEYTVKAQGEYVGKVHDFFFNDKKWTLQCLVIDIKTKKILQKALVSPVIFGQPN